MKDYHQFAGQIVLSNFSQENIKMDKLSFGETFADNTNKQPTKQPNKHAEFQDAASADPDGNTIKQSVQ